MSKKNGSLAIIVLIILGGIYVYIHQVALPEKNSVVKTRTVVDMSGKSIILPEQVQRIGNNGISVPSVILMLGGASKLVAITSGIAKNSWFAKVHQRIEKVATPFAAVVDMERLLMTKPDVVILWSGNEELQNKIESAGIPVVTVFFSNSEEFKRAVFILGEVLGPQETEAAIKFNRYYDSVVKVITDKDSQLSSLKKPKVYYSADAPLNTEGKNSFVTFWIEKAGGVNVAAEWGIDAVRADILMENVIKEDPEIIIVRDAVNKTKILQDDRWKNITAVKNKAVYVNPKGVNVWCTRSGESALQLLWAAKVLHPDVYADIDMSQAVKEFYKTFYSYELSNDEINGILNPTL